MASTSLARSFAVLRPHLRVACAFYLTAVIAAVVPILQVVLLRQFIDDLGAGRPSRTFVVLLAEFSGAFLVGALMRYFAATLSAALAYRIIAGLQFRMFDRLTTMPLVFYTTVRPGAVVSRMTNDVNGIEALYTEVLPAIVSSTVAITVSVALIATVQPLFLLLAVLMPLFLAVVRRAEARINNLINTSFDITRRIANSTESLVSTDGILLTRQNDRGRHEREKFFALTARSAATSSGIARAAANANASYNVAFGIMTTVALGVSVWLALDGRLTTGSVVMTALFVQQLQGPVQALLGTRYPRLRARIAFDRVFQVLDSEVEIDRKSLPPAPDRVVPAPTGTDVTLSLRRVSYAYPPVSAYSIDGLSHVGDAISIPWLPLTGLTPAELRDVAEPGRLVVADLDLDIRAGEIKAIVGRSGSGKSTVALLVAGMLTPSSGRIEIRGMDMTGLGHADLAGRIAFITQDTFILHDSIRANLLYVKPDATDREIIDACAAAQLSTFVEQHDDGLDAVVGEKGHRLSGGERQRVAIARALLKQPDLVILDEATAHLDRRTEADVMAAVLSAFRSTAVLLIAHRLRTVTLADEIIVLEGGMVVQRGVHAELMDDAAGPYARLSKAVV